MNLQITNSWISTLMAAVAPQRRKNKKHGALLSFATEEFGVKFKNTNQFTEEILIDLIDRLAINKDGTKREANIKIAFARASWNELAVAVVRKEIKHRTESKVFILTGMLDKLNSGDAIGKSIHSTARSIIRTCNSQLNTNPTIENYAILSETMSIAETYLKNRRTR